MCVWGGGGHQGMGAKSNGFATHSKYLDEGSWQKKVGGVDWD